MPATVTPPAPFPDLVPIDLGTRFRGDTIRFTLALTDDQGAIVDLTSTDVWFTAKTDLALQDLEVPSFQLSTLSSGVTILEPPTDGRVEFVVPPSATQDLEEDTLFFWDVQCKRLDTVTRAKGTLLIVRDVTRAIG